MTDKGPGGVAKDARDIRRRTRREKHTLKAQGHVRQLVNVLGMIEVARTVCMGGEQDWVSARWTGLPLIHSQAAMRKRLRRLPRMPS